MQYYDSFMSPEGFDFGEAVPPDAKSKRTVYAHALNQLLTHYGSKVRYVMWDAPPKNKEGHQNPCRLALIESTKFTTLRAEFSEEPGDPEVDVAWSTALDAADTLRIDTFVTTETTVDSQAINRAVRKVINSTSAPTCSEP